MIDIDDVAFYDLEVYPGWFLFGVKYRGVYHQWVNDLKLVQDFLDWSRRNSVTLVGYNSNHYDDPVLTAFLRTGDPMAAYRTSVDIIVNQVPTWTLDRDLESIDLMPILPNRLSLKKVGVCLGHTKLQELPVPWDRTPDQGEQQVLLGYNRNDLDITEKLYNAIYPEVKLRDDMSKQYGINLRSKGEATIAELILLHEFNASGRQETKRGLNDVARSYIDAQPWVQVKVPSWWETLVTNKLWTVESIGESVFKKTIPVENDRLQKGFLDRTVFLGDRYYQMGVGGLHSIDGPGAWLPKDDEFLVDIDVASYYPMIILTQGLAPRAWGADFLRIYRTLVDRRLTAKRTGNKTTADVLKIVLNGTYGKSSDPFSALYDPQLTANVTVLGQLGLLALIEMLDGIANVVSANTDGITVLGKRSRQDEMVAIVDTWEGATGFTMEFSGYYGLFQKDVNNYIAMQADGKVKQKGTFIDKWPDLRHTPSANIVATAVVNEVAKRMSLEATIMSCTDINQFILTQSVGGNFTTEWRGQPLGKILRFYKSTNPAAAPIIRTPGEGDKGKQGIVADSESCIPLEDLPDAFPDDVDLDWYITKAAELYNTITERKRTGMNRWAEVLSSVGLVPCMVDPLNPLSRARVEYGGTDFSSLPQGWAFGTGTGVATGLIAAVHDDDRVTVWKADKDYPSSTRAKVTKDHGFKLLYGARVPLNMPMFEVGPPVDFDQYYTPAELKKVGR